MADVVRAAGGVVHRERAGSTEVLLVHRERYDDWTFPKGKLDPGERWERAAVREVFEETGVVPLPGRRLRDTSYRDRTGAPKQVRWWAMEVAADVGREPDHEISARRWVTLDEARHLLTYDRDRELLEDFGTDQRA